MFTHILSKREKKTAIIKKIKFDELGSLYKGAFVGQPHFQPPSDEGGGTP